MLSYCCRWAWGEFYCCCASGKFTSTSCLHCQTYVLGCHFITLLCHPAAPCFGCFWWWWRWWCPGIWPAVALSIWRSQRTTPFKSWAVPGQCGSAYVHLPPSMSGCRCKSHGPSLSQTSATHAQPQHSPGMALASTVHCHHLCLAQTPPKPLPAPAQLQPSADSLRWYPMHYSGRGAHHLPLQPALPFTSSSAWIPYDKITFYL